MEFNPISTIVLTCKYHYVFQSEVYELVEAGMIDTAGSYLAQMEK